MRSERGEVEQAELGDARAVGLRLRWRPSQPALSGRSEIGVDGDHNEIGAGDVGGGLEENGAGGDAGLELVWREIANETPHQARVVGFADDIVVGAGALRRRGTVVGGLLCLSLVVAAMMNRL